MRIYMLTILNMCIIIKYYEYYKLGENNMNENIDSYEKEVSEELNVTKNENLINEFDSEDMSVIEDGCDNQDDDKDIKINLTYIDERFSQMQEAINLISENVNDKNKILNDLSNQIKEFKSDIEQKITSSIFKELISMRDSIIRVGKVYESKADEEKNIPLDVFTSYSYDLQNIFENNGFEIYESNIGDKFIPGRQSAIKRILTENEEQHGTIAESVCNGYALNGKIISAERVSVYYYSDNK